MIAAVDNPSNAMECIVAEMLNNPKTLDKAVEEFDRAVGKERLVQEQDILEKNYIKGCAREALRLHPFAASMSRACHYLIQWSQAIISQRGATWF